LAARAAIKNSGLVFPRQQITIRLARPRRRIQASHDLWIAVVHRWTPLAPLGEQVFRWVGGIAQGVVTAAGKN